jgi:hypothetical protein
MSSIANIVAFDGAATPVSHTLNPINIQRIKQRVSALYREALTNVPVYGQIRVTVYQDDKAPNTGVYRNGILVEVPVMETISNQNAAGYTAAPKVAHIVSVRTELLAHERSDIAIRRLARQLAVNILGNISTTVTPVSTGPVPELFDQLIMPT